MGLGKGKRFEVELGKEKRFEVELGKGRRFEVELGKENWGRGVSGQGNKRVAAVAVPV